MLGKTFLGSGVFKVQCLTEAVEEGGGEKTLRRLELTESLVLLLT